MKVSKLIKLLSELPQEEDIFFGDLYVSSERSTDGIPIYGLFDYDDVEITHFDKVRSARSMLPSSNHIIENVLIIER